jgi:site-specific recombinase XerD
VSALSGKRQEVFAVVQLDAALALKELEDRLVSIKVGKPLEGSASRPRFSESARAEYDLRVQRGDIQSAATKQTWDTFWKYLETAKWWDYYTDAVRREHIQEWVSIALGSKVARGDLAPSTANLILGKLRSLWSAIVDTLDLPTNPMKKIEDFSLKGHRTYTEDEPNSLTPAELRKFLDTARWLEPRWYALFVVGFTFGIRPSHLRPLRHLGADPDLRLDADGRGGLMLIRKSSVLGEVKDSTKTDYDQRIVLPPSIAEVLRWHVDTQIPAAIKQRSELVWPSQGGKLFGMSCPALQMSRVRAEAGISKTITPRGMRRTAVDLQRLAGLEQRVRTALTGHQDESVQAGYETIYDDEIQRGAARVVELVAPTGRLL